MKVYCVPKKKRGFLLLLLLFVLYYIFLNIDYSSFLCKKYAYSGMYVDTDINVHLKWGIAFLISAVVMVFNLNREKVSNVIVMLLYMLWFIPGMVMFGFRKSDFGWMIVLFFALILLFNKISFFDFRLSPCKVSLTDRSLTIVSIFFVALNFYIWARYAGFHIQTSVVDVYGLRIEARGYGMPIFLSYYASISKNIIPVLLILSMLEKKKLISILLLTAQFFSFCSDGAKGTVFTLLFSLILYLCISKWNIRLSLIEFFALGLTILSAFSLLEPILFGTTNILTIFIRRVMFLPHALDYCYYDFFSTHTPDYLHQSFLRHLGFSSVYSMKIPFLIGKIYFSAPAMSANNGLFSDAFSNFGIFGLIVGPVLVVFLLKLFDYCAYGLNPIITISACITLSMGLISSYYFTVLLTHGVLFICAFLYLIPRKPSELRLPVEK